MAKGKALDKLDAPGCTAFRPLPAEPDRCLRCLQPRKAHRGL